MPKLTEVERDTRKDIPGHLDWVMPDLRMLSSMVDAANLDIELINKVDELCQGFESIESQIREACA